MHVSSNNGESKQAAAQKAVTLICWASTTAIASVGAILTQDMQMKIHLDSWREQFTYMTIQYYENTSLSQASCWHVYNTGHISYHVDMSTVQVKSHSDCMHTSLNSHSHWRWSGSGVAGDKAAKPVTKGQDYVPTFVSMTAPFLFKETFETFPSMFMAPQPVTLSQNKTFSKPWQSGFCS